MLVGKKWPRVPDRFPAVRAVGNPSLQTVRMKTFWSSKLEENTIVKVYALNYWMA
jgi:hypothetical protein